MYSRGNFLRNPDQAAATARYQLQIILANKKLLLGQKGGEKRLKAAQDMDAQLQRDGRLTAKQYSFVDGIYERVMAGAGHESVDLHVDKKRKGLRFG